MIMSLKPKALLRLIVPCILLSVAVWGRSYLEVLSDDSLKLAGNAPYLLAIISIILAQQFNRSRQLLLALLTAGAYWLIQSQLQVSLLEWQPRQLYAALGLGVLLVLMFLMLVPERGVLNRYGVIYLLIASALAGISPWLVEVLAGIFVEYPQWLQIWPTENFVMPRGLASLYGGAAILGVSTLCWRDTEAEVALLATLGAIFLALAWFDLPQASLTFFVAAGVIQLISILRSSHAMAYRDDLTGLLGRRALNERMAGLGSKYCLAMLDIDHFKKFNDTYGHDVGDEVLRLVATRIASVGGGGTAFRYGGEEFCIVFPRSSIEQCEAPLEKVRTSIASYIMTIRDKGQRPTTGKDGASKRGRMATKVGGSTVSVTISLGLAERDSDYPNPEAVLKAADKQLYKAKQAGRNKLCF